MLHFWNIRVMPIQKQNKIKGAFQTMLARSGINGESTMSMIDGEIFGLLDRGRPVGGVWIRQWPGRPHEGDIHAAFSKKRFGHYESLVAFDLLLRERARVMGLKKWRVILSADTTWAIRGLTYLKFVEVGRQAFPGIGEAVILEREVR